MSWKLQNIDEHIQEITPINDSKEHFKGDECWCSPRTEAYLQDGYPINIQCSDGYTRGQLVIVHNAQDNREKYEVNQSEALLNLNLEHILVRYGESEYTEPNYIYNLEDAVEDIKKLFNKLAPPELPQGLGDKS